MKTGCSLITNYNLLCIPAFPCPALTVPMHGILACNGWRTDFDNICRVSCLHGYTHPASVHPDTLYVCGATGHWKPANVFDKCTPIGNKFRPPLHFKDPLILRSTICIQLAMTLTKIIKFEDGINYITARVGDWH